LIFGDPVASAASAPAPPQWIELPAGAVVDVALETPITLAETAVGDPVTAVLQHPIKKGGTTWVAKGALLHGRVTLLREQNEQPGGHAVGVRFLELESGTLHAKLQMSLEQIVTAAPNIMVPGSQSPQHSLRLESALMREFQNPALGGVFIVKGSTVKLARGLRMIWRTLPQNSEDPK